MLVDNTLRRLDEYGAAIAKMHNAFMDKWLDTMASDFDQPECVSDLIERARDSVYCFDAYRQYYRVLQREDAAHVTKEKAFAFLQDKDASLDVCKGAAVTLMAKVTDAAACPTSQAVEGAQDALFAQLLAWPLGLGYY